MIRIADGILFKTILLLSIILIVSTPIILAKPQYLTDRDRNELGELKNILPQPNAIELKKIKSFPNSIQEEESQYLWNPNSIGRDNDGNIYVTDTKANSIVVFDSNGKYRYKFGQHGQGPGDLNMPMGIWVIGKEIIVIEARNRRLQWMDLTGKYIKSIKIFKSYWDIAIRNNGELVAAPMFFEAPDDMLIDIMTSDGKMSKKFGKPLIFKNDKDTLNERSITINERNEIIQTFTNIPIIQAYSMQGELINEKVIDTGYSIRIQTLNRRKSTYSEKVSYFPIFKKSFCIGDKIYVIGKLWEHIYIWVLDNKFNIEKTYWYKGGENYFVRDFIPYFDKEKLYIAILNMVDVAKIDIFSPII